MIIHVGSNGGGDGTKEITQMQVQTLANAMPASKSGTTAVVGLQYIITRFDPDLQHIITRFYPGILSSFDCNILSPDFIWIWIIAKWIRIE